MSRGATVGAVMVSVAVADWEESALLVAVTVAVVFDFTAGAVYMPLLLTVPGEADHVTATFEVLVTSAVNCSVPEDATVAVAGLIETATWAAASTVIAKASAPPMSPESVTWTPKL